jgi:hypothetical protein
VTNKQTQVNTNSNNLKYYCTSRFGEGIIGNLDNEVVVLDPSTGIFNSPSILLQIMQIMITIRHKGTGTGLLNNNIREIATSSSGFNVSVSEGQDYSKLENARAES